MNLIWGVILIIFSFIGWIVQVVTVFSPKVAAKFGFTEPKSEVAIGDLDEA